MWKRNIYAKVTIAAFAAGAIFLAYALSPLPIFWEHEDQPLVYSITWHSGLVFLVIFALIYIIVALAFRKS